MNSKLYDEWLEEGREAGRLEGAIDTAREIVINLLEAKFNFISTSTIKTIQKIDSLSILKRLNQSILTVSSIEEFEELLAKMLREEYIMSLDQEFIQISLKNDFKEVFKSGAKNSLSENITTSLAIAAFIEKRVTLARAAELADESLSGFIDLLSKYSIPWIEYTEEIFKEDQKTLAELRGLTDNSKD